MLGVGTLVRVFVFELESSIVVVTEIVGSVGVGTSDSVKVSVKVDVFRVVEI